MSANRNAVSNDFHRQCADDPHEAAIRRGLRIEPEPCCEQAEQKRGNEDLHHAAQLARVRNMWAAAVRVVSEVTRP